MAITEIVTMQTIPGTTKEAFIAIVDSLEKEFHSKMNGYIDSELLYDEKSDEWVMLQHWMTQENLKHASQQMFKAEESALFVKTLDPKTVKMRILPQLGAWNNQSK